MKSAGLLRRCAEACVLAPWLVLATPEGALDTSWGVGPTVPIYGPGLAMAMCVAPIEVTGGAWLPTPSDAPIGFNKNDFYTFCTDAGALIQPSAAYAARSFSSLGRSANPGVCPRWRTDAQGSFLPAIEEAQYLFVHNYAAVFPEVGGQATVNAIQAAGLQLAIWDVLYDPSRDIYPHPEAVFYAGQAWDDPNDTVRSAAQHFLDGVPSDSDPILESFTTPWLDPRLPQNGYPANLRPTQGLVYFKVPESAATLMLLGLALGGLVLVPWKQRGAAGY